MSENYVCKIASEDEVIAKWDALVAQHPTEPNWVVWKAETLIDVRSGKNIPYYGILDSEIICEAYATPNYDPASESGGAPTASAEPPTDTVQTPQSPTAYLSAFRTVKEHRGQGYFSKLMSFMLADLKQKGFKRAILGVEPEEAENKAMYRHWGFTEMIYVGTCTYPDGETIDVEYYTKAL